MFALERIAYFSTRTGPLSSPVRLFLPSPNTKSPRLTRQPCSTCFCFRTGISTLDLGSDQPEFVLRLSAELVDPMSVLMRDPDLFSAPSTLSRRCDSCEL